MAPSRDLFGVPSRSIRVRSIAACSVARAPTSAAGDVAVDVGDRPRDALAAPGLAAVAKLGGLELAGRGARGHRGAPAWRRSPAPPRPRPSGSPASRGSGGRGCGRSRPSRSREPQAPAQADYGRVYARSRKRSASARSASSGSMPRRRASSTRANSASPSQCLAARARPGRPIRSLGRRRPRARPRARGAGSCARTAAPAGSRARRRTARPAPRPSTSRLIRSQLRGRRPGRRIVRQLRASLSPNTCGWRRISFRVMPSATSARLPAPRSSSSSARKWTWKSTSPSSSSKLRVVAAARRVGQLVGLLDRVRDDRALVLLAVPGALAAQPAGDLVEAGESALERCATTRRRRGRLRRGRAARRAPAPGRAPPGTPGRRGGSPAGRRRGFWGPAAAPGASPGPAAVPGSATLRGERRRLAPVERRRVGGLAVGRSSSAAGVGGGWSVGAEVDHDRPRRRRCATVHFADEVCLELWSTCCWMPCWSCWPICSVTSASGVVGLGDLLDLDHVAAAVALERADELALGGGEDLPRRAPARSGPRPRPRAGRRSFLVASSVENCFRDLLPVAGRVVLLQQRLVRLLDLRLVLVEDHAHVARLGLLELVLVGLVEVLDVGVGDVGGSAAATCSWSLVAERRQLRPSRACLLVKCACFRNFSNSFWPPKLLLDDLVEAWSMISLSVTVMPRSAASPRTQRPGSVVRDRGVAQSCAYCGSSAAGPRLSPWLSGGLLERPVELLLGDLAVRRVLDDRDVARGHARVADALGDRARPRSNATRAAARTRADERLSCWARYRPAPGRGRSPTAEARPAAYAACRTPRLCGRRAPRKPAARASVSRARRPGAPRARRGRAGTASSSATRRSPPGSARAGAPTAAASSSSGVTDSRPPRNSTVRAPRRPSSIRARCSSSRFSTGLGQRAEAVAQLVAQRAQLARLAGARRSGGERRSWPPRRGCSRPAGRRRRRRRAAPAPRRAPAPSPDAQRLDRLVEQRDVELEADRRDVARLLVAEQVAGAAQLEVAHRDREARAELGVVGERRQARRGLRR